MDDLTLKFFYFFSSHWRQNLAQKEEEPSGLALIDFLSEIDKSQHYKSKESIDHATMKGENKDHTTIKSKEWIDHCKKGNKEVALL